MIEVGAFAVFALGLRHGADPDHLAAIDNLTRSMLARRPALSRFVGSLFAIGHSVMVLAVAALVGILGQRFAVHGALVERISTWVSILMLTLIGWLNIQQFSQGDSIRLRGIKTRLLPHVLRNGTHPFIAVCVGFLFGFGFETSSQIVTYTVAFGSGGLAGALFIGALFCLGMIVTDTLDSVLVYRLVHTTHRALARSVAVWTWSVAGMAFAVAGYEAAQLLGWHSPLPDIALSGILIGTLLCVFTYVFLSTRTHTRRGALMIQNRFTRMLSLTIMLSMIVGAGVLYAMHPSVASDHQDAPTVIDRPRADITDVYVFPSPSNPAATVFVMNVDPLLTPSTTGNEIFDPAVMYQFKIAHGPVGTAAPEDQVIQIAASGDTPATQQITIYGPGKPNATGTNSTFISSSGSVPFNATSGTTLANGIKAFVGPRADPFFFDLAQFFTILPDRDSKNSRTGNTLGTTTPTFNGFTAGTLSAPGGYACSTAPSQNALTELAAPGFNVLSIVLEVPTLMLTAGYPSAIIHVWATTSTQTGA